MSTSTTSPVVFATQQFVIYVGIPILIMGIIGGILNIVVFLSLKTFRQSSCAFFLTIMSFVNIGQLITSLLSRIMISGFNTDWTATSLSYCKFRNYCIQACALISYTCMCLATIDQFLATSRQVQWQQLLNIKRAYGLSIITFIVWLLHGIPSLMYYNLVVSSTTGKTSCTITNSIFQKYITYVYIITFTGVLPIFFTVIFGSLAYWHVRQIPYRVVPLVRRALDKQLTTMVLVQVCLNVIVIVPYIIMLFLIYTLDLTSNSINVPVFNMVSLMFGVIYYLYFASPFYIYVSVSKRFRQQLIHVLTNIYFKWWKHQPIAINQVSPEGEEQ